MASGKKKINWQVATKAKTTPPPSRSKPKKSTTSKKEIEPRDARKEFLKVFKQLMGVAAYIKVGNTFTEPISPDDAADNYWFTPVYFSDVWMTRRLIQKMNSLLKGGFYGCDYR